MLNCFCYKWLKHLKMIRSQMTKQHVQIRAKVKAENVCVDVFFNPIKTLYKNCCSIFSQAYLWVWPLSWNKSSFFFGLVGDEFTVYSLWAKDTLVTVRRVNWSSWCCCSLTLAESSTEAFIFLFSNSTYVISRVKEKSQRNIVTVKKR